MYDPTLWNAGQKDFIDQYTRGLLVKWSTVHVMRQANGLNPDLGTALAMAYSVYYEYALYKGWVSKKKSMVTSKGFKVAASYLRRGAAVGM